MQCKERNVGANGMSGGKGSNGHIPQVVPGSTKRAAALAIIHNTNYTSTAADIRPRVWDWNMGH